jgi:DNA repair exonuclease SbcCD ATPase subunit
MSQNDALRVVQFHGWDYTRDWEINITHVRTSLEKAERFIRSLNHYTSSAVKQIEEHIKDLEWASEQLDQLIKGITRDVRTLQRYVPLFYRLRNSLWLRWVQSP